MSSLIRFLALILVSFLSISLAASDDEPDPVLQYYWDHARAASHRTNPDSSGICYGFTAKTFKRSVADDGRIRKTDSVVQNYYFCGGNLDSVNTVAGDGEKFKRLNLSSPPVFESPYHLSSFPNDIGGRQLAIRIWSDSALGHQPDGMVVIDRNEYFPHALYLYYPDKSGYRRFTRSFRFVVVDGFVFPDSIWEVATRLGVFSAESYRLETGISDIRVWRANARPEQ
ncbi:MAG: hypothetical protein NTW07_07100 [candidate division Zixibacteria bacterium]|nr:hypothetical protein [candidate division Zixibacteria bacterium]